MCTQLCGPLTPPPSAADKLRRLYVDRVAHTDYHRKMLAVFDTLTPEQQTSVLSRVASTLTE